MIGLRFLVPRPCGPRPLVRPPDT